MSPATTAEAAALSPNALDLGLFPPAPTGLWNDPSVLCTKGTPRALVGRDALLAELAASLPAHGGARAAVVLSGPPGVGTSAVASRLVDLARARMAGPAARARPLVLRLDAGAARTPGTVATALYRGLEPGAPVRGACTEFLLLLFLRRLRGVGRPVLVWIDQVRGREGALSRALLPLLSPERVMPEGAGGLPPILLVTSGSCDPLGSDVPVSPDVRLLRAKVLPLSREELVEAVLQRASLAFARAPGPGFADAVATLLHAGGWGLGALAPVLTEAGRRAQGRGAVRVEREDVALPEVLPRRSGGSAGGARAFDVLLVAALREARGAAGVAALREALAARCAAEGLAAPTPARLWRHLVALERRGVVRRDVRLGGRGGSRTLVSAEAQG